MIQSNNKKITTLRYNWPLMCVGGYSSLGTQNYCTKWNAPIHNNRSLKHPKICVPTSSENWYRFFAVASKPVSVFSFTRLPHDVCPVCLFLCMCVYVCFGWYVSLCVSVQCVFFFFCLSMGVPVGLSVGLSGSVFCIYVCVCLCVCVCVCVSLKF